MSKIFNCLFQLLVIYLGVTLSLDYNFKDQNNWGVNFPECNGDRQTPINIDTQQAIQEYFPAIEFVGYHNLIRGDSYFMNDGKTVTLQIGENDFKPYIFGGRLPGVFVFENFHFHWGLTNVRGGDHEIDNEQYSMEMHLVHRNRKYRDLTEALGHHDGIAVLGILLDEKPEDNNRLKNIVEHVAQLKQYNSMIPVQSPIVLAWYLPRDVDNFFLYEGSLTTPPCSEAVTWVVFPEHIGISNRQLHVFRNLQTENNRRLVNNFREIQPLNGRLVYQRNFTFYV